MLAALLLLAQSTPVTRDFDLTDIALPSHEAGLPPLRLHPFRDEFDLRTPEELRLEEIRAVLRGLVGPKPSQAVLDAIDQLRPDRLHADPDREPAVLALLQKAGGESSREAVTRLLRPLVERPTDCHFGDGESELIKNLVAPGTWEGAFRFDVLPNGKALGIHRPEVLDEVERFVKALRSMRPTAAVALEAEIRDPGDAPRRLLLSGLEGRLVHGGLRGADRVDLLRYSASPLPGRKAILLDLHFKSGRRNGPGRLGIVELQGSMELRDGEPAVFALPGGRSLTLRATASGTPAPTSCGAGTPAMPVRILGLRDFALNLPGSRSMTLEDWANVVKNGVRRENWEEADGKFILVWDGLLFVRNTEPVLREVEAFIDARRTASVQPVTVEAALPEGGTAGAVGVETLPESLSEATRITLRGFAGQPLAVRWSERTEGQTAEGRFGVTLRRVEGAWEAAVQADLSRSSRGGGETDRLLLGTDIRIPDGRSAVLELSGDASGPRKVLLRPAAR